MIRTTYEQQQQQQGTPVYNYPIGEYYSYYPTWCQTTTTTTPRTTPTTGVYSNVEDIVITGVSGRFPEGENIDEYSRQMFGTPVVRPTTPVVKPEYQPFDHGFFGINEIQAQQMDLHLRTLLEVTYESIFDCGYNPMEFKGTKTGVFIGTYGLGGKIMGPLPQYATEIARYFDFTGPTYTIDTTVESSGLVALDNAISSIRNGMCQQAVVAGINIEGGMPFYEGIQVRPMYIGTVGVVFLQRRNVARRFYATVVISKSIVTPINGEKEVNFTYTNGESFYKLLREVYRESNIDPNLVTYLETHGNDKIVDSNEYKLITDVFTKNNRSIPFFVGSTKLTGVEHGVISLVRMLIAMQRGVIPASLKYQQPIGEQFVNNNYWKYVNENTRFQGGLMALNSFGFRGTSVHIALQPNNELVMGKYGQQLLWNQDYSQYTKLPRVFHFSSRTEEGLLNVLEEMYGNPSDLPTQFLLSGHSLTTPTTHPFRGFTILNGQKKIREFKRLNGVEKRPLWFLFNGLGTQWYGMGKELMQVDYFSTIMQKIADILRPYGFDLIQYLMKEDRTSDAFYSTILINSIQIAFVDMMKYMGVQPDGIVGYSIGEIVAAYADNALTLEESVLSTYYFAKFIKDTGLRGGSMARIGLSWEEVSRSCPKSIYPSFSMGKDQCIVSGPERAIMQYVELLKTRGIHAAEIESFDLGLNSCFMKPIVSQFVSQLQSIIRTPKLRSSKWYSTTYKGEQVPEYAKYASPEYFSYCLMNPVYLYETIQLVPQNAITLEFGPTPFYEYYLGQTLGENNYCYINFMKPQVPHHLEHFWYNFGRLYTEGYNVDGMKLVLPITKQLVYPVPHTTRFLSPLVSWYRPSGKPYSPKYEQFELPQYYKPMYVPTTPTTTTQQTLYGNGHYVYKIDLTQNEYQYLNECVVNGKVTYPTGGYFHLVWQSFAQLRNIPMQLLPVVFEDVHFVGCPVVIEPVSTPVTLIVRFVDQQTGRFEIMYNNKVIVHGKIMPVPETTSTPIGWTETYQSEYLNKPLTDFIGKEEIYKEFLLKGYDYSNLFQGIIKTNINGTRGELFWNQKWTPFLESMIQMHVFSKNGKEWPSYIQSLRIDPRYHAKYINKIIGQETPRRHYTPGDYLTYQGYQRQLPTGQQYPIGGEYPTTTTPYEYGTLPVMYDQYTRTFVSGGVEMTGIQSVPLPKTFEEQPMVLERVNFVPYFERYTEQQQQQQPITGIETGEFKPNFEYIDAYINEVKYYIGEILRRMESFGVPSMKSTSSYDSLSSFTGTTGSYVEKTFNGCPIEGKFLQLLKNIYNIEYDSQFLNKVKELLGNENYLTYFYKTWSEDPVFYFTGGRYNYLKSTLETVLENVGIFSTERPTLKVLEIAPQFHAFGSKIHELIGMHPSVRVDYHYVQVGDYDVDMIREWTRNSSYPVTKINWDILTQELPTKAGNDYDLVIFNNTLGLLPFIEDKQRVCTWLETLSRKLVKPQGFFLVHEFVNHFDTMSQLGRFEDYLHNGKYLSTYRPYKYQNEGEWRKYFDNIFHPIAIKNDNVLSSFFLYRRPYVPTRDIEILINDVTTFNWIEKVKQALKDTTCNRIWLICEKAYTSGLIGLVNCLRHEPRGELIRCVFIGEPVTAGNWRINFDTIKRGDLFMNVYKFGKWGSYKNLFDLHDLETPYYFNQPSKYAYVDWLRHGDLSTLQWFQSPKPIINTYTQLPINVSYTGLGHRDYLIASGLLHPETLTKYNPYLKNVFGMEFSGYYNDKRYMGITPGYGLSTVIPGDKRYLWEIPQEWTLEQASTVPYSYAQAYYSLLVRGGLCNNESVLIHYGATPFGQAAISIALGYNCKVFVTVNSTEERDFLMSLFPGKLFHESFIYLNDKFFDRVIMKYTQGKGVNLVLNWYNGEYVPQFVRCLSPYGRFVELCDYMPTTNGQQFTHPMLYNKNISYHNVFFDSVFEPENYQWSKVYKYIQEGIQTGIVRPLKYTVFDRYKIQEAFRHLVDMKPFEKVLVKIGEPTINATQRLWFSPYYSYIITGGVSTFGLELAQWLCERGVRKLFLTSRFTTRTPYQQRKLDFLQQTYGCIITVSYYDVEDDSECLMLIKEAQEMSEEKKIGGVFHLETAFIQGPFDTLAPEQFKHVMNRKYMGLYNLDKYLRNPECYFVVFSSLVSGRGYPGSSVYGYVNSAVERLCELRRLEGNHAIAIQWGPIGELMSVFQTPETETIYNGILPQRVWSTLNMLEHILLRSPYSTIWSSYVPLRNSIPYPVGYETDVSDSDSESDSDDEYYYVPKTTPSTLKYTTLYERPTTTYKPTTKLNVSPFEYLYQLLGLKQSSTVRYNTPLVSYGLTSTLAGEFKTYLEKYYNVSYPIEQIQQLTFDNIRSMFPFYPVQSIAHPTQYTVKMPTGPCVCLNKMTPFESTTKLFKY